MTQAHYSLFRAALIAAFLSIPVLPSISLAADQPAAVTVAAPGPAPRTGATLPTTATAVGGLVGGWALVGPGGGGRITSIAEDPSDPKRLFLTINVGGIRRSVDGGQSWQTCNRGLPYAELGAKAHAMMDVAVHPKDGRVVLAASLHGGIYISTDGGSTWTRSFQHPCGCDYSRFTFDPANPDVAYVAVGSIQKLFLGVGARRTGDFWPPIAQGPNVLVGRRSSATGSWTWEAAGTIEGKPRHEKGKVLNVYSLAVHARSGDLLAVTERGLYRGRRDARGLVAAFSEVTGGLPPAADFHGGKIVFDPRNPDVAYLTALNLDNRRNGQEGVGGVFKSTDGGTTWTKLGSGLDRADSNYFDVALDPRDSSIVYVAQFANDLGDPAIEGTLYRSADAGKTWRDIVDRSKVDSGWHALKRFGPDFVSPSVTPGLVRWSIGGGALLVGTVGEGGSPRWSNPLTRRLEHGTWTTTGSEAVALAQSIGISPNDPETIYLPYGDHDYFVSRDGGRSLAVLVSDTGVKRAGNRFDSGTMVVDELDPRRIYVATQGPHQALKDGGVMASLDGGATWRTLGGDLKRGDRGLPRAAMTDLAVEVRGDARRLYVARYADKRGGVYMLPDADGAQDWERVLEADKARSIALRGDALFVGEDGRGLYRLERTRDLWKRVWGPKDVGGSATYYDIEIGPKTGNAYVATDRGLFVVDAQGAARKMDIPALSGLPRPDVHAVEVNARNEDHVYVASERGELVRTVDGGRSWEIISKDVPTLGFVVLALDPATETIYAGVAGGGIWKRSFAP